MDAEMNVLVDRILLSFVGAVVVAGIGLIAFLLKRLLDSLATRDAELKESIESRDKALQVQIEDIRTRQTHTEVQLASLQTAIQSLPCPDRERWLSETSKQLSEVATIVATMRGREARKDDEP
jgi:hypothetical protein